MRRAVDRHGLQELLRKVNVLHRSISPRARIELRAANLLGIGKEFDQALDLIHYAGSCRRVGRCMRLAILADNVWIGGIVLGSTFPNIRVRDEALGLSRYVRDWRERNLISPWARENRPYWKALQGVVNHARTFIFPPFQGRGLGVKALAELDGQGRTLWQQHYGDRIWAFDTLCTHEDSKLFLSNGWKLVGRTEGYTSHPSSVFSQRAFKEDWKTIINNVALQRIEGGMRWWVWIRKVGRFPSL